MDDGARTNLTCPFWQPGSHIKLLGSCNGMVCVALTYHDGFYIWNPCTGSYRRLPNPGFVSGVTAYDPTSKYNPPFDKMIHCLHHSGFGYVSATDEYKVIVSGYFWDKSMHMEIFSSRANSWKTIEVPDYSDGIFRRGTLSHKALHWMREVDGYENNEIVAFDLEKEELRKIPLPLLDEVEYREFEEIGVVFGGCLCFSVFEEGPELHKKVKLWVMMKYGDCRSWTKMFQFSMVYCLNSLDRAMLHIGSSMVVWRWKSWGGVEPDELVRLNLLGKDVVECSGRYRVEKGDCDMIDYEETILWLDDHLGKEENVKRLGTQHRASTSRNVEK